MSTPVLIVTIVGSVLFGVFGGIWLATWAICEWVKGWGK